MNRLFPDSFLSAISRLNLRIRVAPPKPLAGVHLSRQAGLSLQFRDYQMYISGDDLRRVDWNVYARTRHLFVRRFERPTAVPIFILVDASQSMLIEEAGKSPARYIAAARGAAAVAAAAVASQNPFYLGVTDSEFVGRRPLNGRQGLFRALTALAADRRRSTVPISQAIQALGPLLSASGPGVLVVISDFFDDHGATAVVNALRKVPGRLLLLQVVQAEDQNPHLLGDYEFIDCESNAAIQISSGEKLLKRYLYAYSNYFDAIKRYADARGARWLMIDAASDTLGQLQPIFPGGTLSL